MEEFFPASGFFRVEGRNSGGFQDKEPHSTVHKCRQNPTDDPPKSRNSFFSKGFFQKTLLIPNPKVGTPSPKWTSESPNDTGFLDVCGSEAHQTHRRILTRLE
ncbi:hypothetical protein CH380_17670 [Leptospira adleri]|uniref:Uncharacterized protein n=1 Tax=Leptospira adleri TaxID=2023186 RepID=A0A2M9YK24_9LEPT|nr:hypothetical protein CH380_17670 [Leptospira adleri]PJZ60165.1 hypothetical protein CH376_19805 [Leptospira adleri]